MIGRYGEVVLMDWGVAKVLPTSPLAAATPSQFTTQQGSIIGTPAYMSPEQASGNINAVDARSDLYSATVLFHEFLSLRHYLTDYETFQQLIIAILSERFPYMRLVFIRHPRHPVPPAELLHFVARGLQKDPAQRYATAAEMVEELQRIRDGRCRVSCPATLARRSVNGVSNFIGRFPKLSPFIFYSFIVFWIGYIALTAPMLFHRAP